jgi:hypothetical protein
MPRVCSICTHKKKEAINAALLETKSFRKVAARFHVAASSCFRHLRKCMREELKNQQLLSSQRLASELALLLEKTRSALQQAEEQKSLPGQALLLDRLGRNIDLLGRLGATLQRIERIERVAVSDEDLRSTALSAIEKALGISGDELIERVEDPDFVQPVEAQYLPAEAKPHQPPATVEAEVIRPPQSPQRALPPAPSVSGVMSVTKPSLLGENFLHKKL